MRRRSGPHQWTAVRARRLMRLMRCSLVVGLGAVVSGARCLAVMSTM